jgi:DNA helicase HerA-like ATPase
MTAQSDVAAGYASAGAAIELGAVLVDGAVEASARVRLPLATLNRHGLVAGATGTGKTKTLQLMAEQLSAAGVPVVMAKTVKTYSTTPHYELDKALTSLGTGEAIVTVLSEQGAPTPVAWTRLRAPRSLMDTIGPDAIRQDATSSELHVKYSQTIDRESAYEKLTAEVAPSVEPQETPPERAEPGAVAQVLGNPAVKSFLRSAESALGREITRGLFGTSRKRR